MKRYILLIIVNILLFSLIYAQPADTLTLFECYELARTVHPVSTQIPLLSTVKDLNIKNANVSWYPSFELNGKYTWQSEVVEFPFTLPVQDVQMPSMPHYNYKLTLDVQQTIYDGGITRSRKSLEQSRYEIDRQQVEVELNSLKERINQVYFQLLILQQQEKLIVLALDELEKRSDVVKSGVDNGLLLRSDLDVMKAEIIRTKQKLLEVKTGSKTGYAILSELTGKEITTGTVLSLPASEVMADSEIQRPEHILFDLQANNLDASKKMAVTRLRPKAYVFGQLGYGNPALNFFKDEFRTYYIVGAGFSWKLWDWNENRREREVLDVQQDILRSNKEVFDKNLNMMLDEDLGHIREFEESVKLDMEIVTLRERVSKSAASQLENGVITSTEYITELNAETQARINLETHKIQLVQAKVNYFTTKGEI